MIFSKKIQAGAFQFVLFIGAVIAILLLTFLLFSFSHRQFDKKTDILINLVKNANFGIETSLNKGFPLHSSIEIPNENTIEIAIEVQRDLWGVFEKRTVTTTHGKTTYVKTALVGGKDKTKMPAVYVSDHQRPVIIAGNSKITGDAFLPAQGLKMGNIRGNSYNHSSLLFGQQKLSRASLPKLSREIIAQLTQLTQYNYNTEVELLHTIPETGLKNSFQSPTIVIRNQVVHLENTSLVGNIIISAADRIIVEANTNLHDVVLLAPEIIIKSGVKGNFQAIATVSISVGKNCKLRYPSALVVLKKPSFVSQKNANSTKGLNTKPAIYLDTYSWVGGTVIALDNSKEQQYAPQIKIEANAKVVGEIYCTKNLELKGSVEGNVTTNGFIALEDGSVYQNHLYNGIINSKSLDESYVGLLLASREQNKRVMKWLY